MNGLWIQNAQGQFSDRASGWGVADPGRGRGAIVADLDDNGWPDLISRNLGPRSTVHRGVCGARHWLKVRVRQDGMNTHAIGAVVRVVTPGGAQVRWVGAGNTSLFSSGPPEVLFGLGDHDEVWKLEVTWPDGARSVLGGVEPDQTWTFVREAP